MRCGSVVKQNIYDILMAVQLLPACGDKCVCPHMLGALVDAEHIDGGAVAPCGDKQTCLHMLGALVDELPQGTAGAHKDGRDAVERRKVKNRKQKPLSMFLAPLFPKAVVVGNASIPHCHSIWKQMSMEGALEGLKCEEKFFCFNRLWLFATHPLPIAIAFGNKRPWKAEGAVLYGACLDTKPALAEGRRAQYLRRVAFLELELDDAFVWCQCSISYGFES